MHGTCVQADVSAADPPERGDSMIGAPGKVSDLQGFWFTGWVANELADWPSWLIDFGLARRLVVGQLAG